MVSQLFNYLICLYIQIYCASKYKYVLKLFLLAEPHLCFQGCFFYSFWSQASHILFFSFFCYCFCSSSPFYHFSFFSSYIIFISSFFFTVCIFFKNIEKLNNVSKEMCKEYLCISRELF